MLDSYVGTYELGQGVIVVSRVGRALAIQMNGQPAKNELLAETPVRFFQRGSNVAFGFQGDGGTIDRLVVESGDQRRTATRRKYGGAVRSAAAVGAVGVSAIGAIGRNWGQS